MSKVLAGQNAGGIHRRLCRPILFAILLVMCILIGYVMRIVIDYWTIALKIKSAHGEDPTMRRISHLQAQEVASLSNIAKDASETTVTNACNNGCSVGFCGDQLPQPSAFQAVSTEIQIFLSERFPCAGTIVAWRFIDYDPRPGKVIYLDVLRYINTTDDGTWMAFNRVITNGKAGWQTYDIPIADRIHVNPPPGGDLFFGFHFDDVAADAIIPFADKIDVANGIKRLANGLTILMDHQEISRLAKPGVTAEVKMTPLFTGLMILPTNNWRIPALAAIVEPDAV